MVRKTYKHKLVISIKNYKYNTYTTYVCVGYIYIMLWHPLNLIISYKGKHINDINVYKRYIFRSILVNSILGTLSYWKIKNYYCNNIQ